MRAPRLSLLFLSFALNAQTIEGTVTNKLTGSPVRNARVKFALAVPGKTNSVPGSDTDSSGHFAVQVEPGSYRFWAERNGFAKSPGALSPINVSAGQQVRDLAIQMTPLGAISGRIFDEDGDPAQGVGIQVLKVSYGAGRRRLIPAGGATTNDRGEFRAFGLPAAHYYLTATRISAPTDAVFYPGTRDVASATEVPLPEGGDTGGIDLRLPKLRTFTLGGRLLSPAGLAGQVQTVLAHDEANTASYVGRQTGNVDPATGIFQFHGVAPGAYWLIGSQWNGRQWLGGRVRVDVGEAVPPKAITVPLSAGFAINGLLQLEGGGNLPEPKIELIDAEGLSAAPIPPAVLGAAGQFRLTGVTGGIWDLAVGALPEGLCVKSATLGETDLLTGDLALAAEPRALLHIVLAANCGQITGAVVDARGQPRIATVVLVPADPRLRTARQLYAAVVTQEQGAFTINGVRPGAYKLFALDEVEPFEWLNPEMYQAIESKGEPVTVALGDKVSKRLDLVTGR